MKRITVTVGGVTYALKLQRLLKSAGIRSRQVKVDNTADGPGCSHGVEIYDSDFYSAVVIMRENRINYSVYQER